MKTFDIPLGSQFAAPPVDVNMVTTALLNKRDTPSNWEGLERIGKALQWEFGGTFHMNAHDGRARLFWWHTPGAPVRDQVMFARGCWRLMRGKPPRSRRSTKC